MLGMRPWLGCMLGDNFRSFCLWLLRANPAAPSTFQGGGGWVFACCQISASRCLPLVSDFVDNLQPYNTVLPCVTATQPSHRPSCLAQHLVPLTFCSCCCCGCCGCCCTTYTPPGCQQPGSAIRAFRQVPEHFTPGRRYPMVCARDVDALLYTVCEVVI